MCRAFGDIQVQVQFLLVSGGVDRAISEDVDVEIHKRQVVSEARRSPPEFSVVVEVAEEVVPGFRVLWVVPPNTNDIVNKTLV